MYACRTGALCVLYVLGKLGSRAKAMRTHEEGRCKDGKRSLRFVCLTFGRGEERRIRQRTREAIQRAHSDAKSEAEARAPVRHSIQCPWTPCRQAAAAAASIQFHHRLPADAMLIPACCSPSSPHIAIVLGNATAFCNCLAFSPLHQSLHNALSHHSK